jgi:peptidoglycan/xylan/chitin deacetylase (PgdA/CDA1 family)
VREAVRQVARRVRHAGLAGFRAAGGFGWVAGSAWRRRRLLILCYHGVSLRDEHEWNNLLFVTTAFLRRRLEILRDARCTVLPLGEAVERLRGGTLPPRSVAITFDDGYYNFYAAATPLLEEFGVPATNYVSTYYCVHQRPIPPVAIRYLLWRARPQVLAPGTLPGQHTTVDLQDPQQREQLAERLSNAPQDPAGDRASQEAWLGDVATRLGIDWDELVRSRLFHLMNPEEVRDMARRGFDMQLHTHRHRTPRDEADFSHEVLENRRILEELTRRPATHFCYPSGDVDAVFLPWLRGLDVVTATTTAIAGMANAGHEPLLLPRFSDTMAQSEVLFESWLSGVGDMLRPRRA